MITSKGSEYINQAVNYIRDIGLTISNVGYLSKEMTDKIPIVFSHGYQLSDAKILGQRVALALDETNTFTPAQTEKADKIISGKLGMPVIFIYQKQPSYNIRRLIERRINFVIPGKQMFVPSMIIDLRKEKRINADIKEKIHPISQVILLYEMERGGLNGRNMREISDVLNCSYATVNRATRWLKEKDLINLDGDKEKSISFGYQDKELWEASRPYLTTPIDRVVYTDEVNLDLPVSGINALSKFTMINGEDKGCFAIGKDDFRGRKINTDKNFGSTTLEIWRYNPLLLGSPGTVDPLSLYLSLHDNEDERIQMELDNLIENIKWSEE